MYTVQGVHPKQLKPMEALTLISQVKEQAASLLYAILGSHFIGKLQSHTKLIQVNPWI